jgi:hypothetical protein
MWFRNELSSLAEVSLYSYANACPKYCQIYGSPRRAVKDAAVMNPVTWRYTRLNSYEHIHILRAATDINIWTNWGNTRRPDLWWQTAEICCCVNIHSGQWRKSVLFPNVSFVHRTPACSANPFYKSLLEGNDHGVTVELSQLSEFGTSLYVK